MNMRKNNRAMFHRLRALLIAGSLLLILFGCTKDPFSTRSSEPPITTGGTYTEPFAPDIAVENLFHAYNERNIGNYTRIFADSFQFSFDFLNIGQPGEVATVLLNEEIRITENIFRSVDTLLLAWDVSQTDIEDDSSGVFYRAYEIDVVTGDSVTDTTTYAGEAIFYLRIRDDARWEIVRWEDRHLTGDQFSWADLKWRYR